MSRTSRRRFLEDSMMAATIAAAAAWRANPASKLFAEEPAAADSPNEKLRVCCVGTGGRGRDHINEYLRHKGCEITYLVDPDETIGPELAAFIARKQNFEPKVVPDMRMAYDDKNVDVVSIATPNHWHALAAIWALQAGKDVYVEKPVSHNVSEGRRLVQVARKQNKLCQTGTQSRSKKAMLEAIEYMRAGKIGDITVARALCYKRRPSIGPKGDYPVPAGVNYDLWAGPAPMGPVTRKRFHYDWHWQWPYGNGDLGNQGIHQMDVARWGLNTDKLPESAFSFGGRIGYEDAGETANTQVCFFDYGKQALIFEVRGLETEPYLDAKIGNIFHGTDGYVMLTSGDLGAAFDKEGHRIRDFSGDGDHFGNFLTAVRDRKPEDLHADIVEGHLSSALCHLGNISYRLAEQKLSVAELGSKLAGDKAALASNDLFNRLSQHVADNKLDINTTMMNVGPTLAFDSAQERFVGSDAANAMLTRDYRAPYIVPTADKI